jgi:hypothetical protein
VKPGAQSLLPEQLVRHAPALQRLGSQLWLAPGTQAPAPLQALGWRVTMSVQLDAHAVPATHLRHMPAPSHLPSRPHVEASVATHPASAVPAARGAQRPARPARLHAMHGPQLAAAQQTPFVQWPLLHSAPALQAVPWGLSWQVPLMQELGAAHSAAVVQLVRQLPPAQA